MTVHRSFSPSLPGRRLLLVGAALAVAVPAWAQRPAALDHDHGEPQDILDCLRGIAACSRFNAALDESGMAASLRQMPDVTVFAPVNAAWPAAALDAAQRRRLVQQHVCAVRWAAVGGNERELVNLNMVALQASMDDVSGAGYVLQGLPVRNGWVHVMQRVL